MSVSLASHCLAIHERNSHKIAINHKRLCFIKICVCVYYVFVRYIHVRTSEMWNACRSLARARSFEHNKFSVEMYDICRHIMEPNPEQNITRSRIEYELDRDCVYVCVCECVSTAKMLRMKLLAIFMLCLLLMLRRLNRVMGFAS